MYYITGYVCMAWNWIIMILEYGVCNEKAHVRVKGDNVM